MEARHGFRSRARPGPPPHLLLCPPKVVLVSAKVLTAAPSFPYQPPPANTHLDPPEIPVGQQTVSISFKDPPDPAALKLTFRHSGWQRQRQQVHQALGRTQAPWERRVAFAHCGSYFWIMRHKIDPTRFKAVPDHCHDRFCVPCGAARQATIRDNLAKLLLAEPHRLLTLTVRSTGEPLAKLLDHLYRSFRRLRQRPLWKRRVRGGVAFLEITYSPGGGGWHPHLHCILEGLYVDRPALTELWKEATGDSIDLHLKLISCKKGVIGYVTKYATKPLPASVVGVPALLDEAILTLAGRRFLVTFGRWRKWKLLADDTHREWTLYAHQNDLYTRFKNDDDFHLRVAEAMLHPDPETGEFTVATDVDPPIN